eukprot:12295015-Ditylum_brightwellii.AAC.1
MGIGGTVKVTGDTAFCSIEHQVGCFRVNMQLHVTHKEVKNDVWICSKVVMSILHSLVAFSVGLAWLGLVGGDFVEGWKDGAVYCMAIIQKHSHNG